MADFNTEQLLEMLQRQGGAGNLDLSGHDLTGINLSGEALEELLDELGYAGVGRGPLWFEPWTKGVSLSHAHLREAQLRMADLRNACLENADLRGADLSGAELNSVNLAGADIDGARLDGANLTGTNLAGTSMVGTSTSGTCLA